jgi:hypothetical protein
MPSLSYELCPSQEMVGDGAIYVIHTTQQEFIKKDTSLWRVHAAVENFVTIT